MEKLQNAIQKIEEEVKRTQVNKATEYHLGQLRAKHSKLTRQMNDIKNKPQKSYVQEHRVEKSGQISSGQLLEDMDKLTENYQFNNVIYDLYSKDKEQRINILTNLQQLKDDQDICAVYICKLDQSKQVVELATQILQNHFAAFTAEDRKLYMCETVLPFILAYTENIIALKQQEQNITLVQVLIKALVPFCQTQYQKDRLKKLFKTMLIKKEYVEFQALLQQGLQLIQ